MDSLEQYFSSQLEARRLKGTLRKLRRVSPDLKDFTSNDYLGLARSENLQRKIAERINTLTIKNGATGSRLLSGNNIYYEQLENQLAGVFQAQACLVFNSGYTANMGVLSAIPSRHDTILYDELCHTSLKDGVRLSLATKHPFRHNDLNDLEQKIKIAKGKIFIVVESIYSMDGDRCPLHELVSLSEKYNGYLILDEAHSTGALGVHGAGLAVSLEIQNKIAIRIYTFGKAIGAHGACVAGSRNLIQYLINFSRPLIYTTALPDHTIISIAESFDFIKRSPELQQVLESKINTFRNSLNKNLTTSTTAIQTIICESVEKTYAKAMGLVSKGFDVRPIVSPTVPQGKERLRICLHTFNSDQEIAELAKELNIQ